MFGADFWARFQLVAWKELAAVECVVTYNRNRSKGECFTTGFGVPAVYDDPEEGCNASNPILSMCGCQHIIRIAQTSRNGWEECTAKRGCHGQRDRHQVQ